jgi:hypothetical protein
MWDAAEISLFFSLFGVKPELVTSLSSRGLSRKELDGFSEDDFLALTEIDKCTARVMHTLWHQICTFRHCAQDALDQVKDTLVSRPS